MPSRLYLAGNCGPASDILIVYTTMDLMCFANAGTCKPMKVILNGPPLQISSEVHGEIMFINNWLYMYEGRSSASARPFAPSTTKDYPIYQIDSLSTYDPR